MTKIAVTGGSGQLGSLIVRRLLDRPDIDTVVSIDRSPPPSPVRKLEYVEADVRDEDLHKHFAQCAAVVHCAFLVTQNAPPALLRSVNVEGSRNVFRAVAAAGVEHLVHLSSMMAYGSVAGHPVPIVEGAPRIYQGDFPYAACKHRVEALLDEFEVAHPQIAVCRLRPAVLLGRDMPHILGWLLRWKIVPAHGGAPLPIVADEDVADLAVLALDKRARGAFNASADELLTAEDIAKRFGMWVLAIPRIFVHGYRGLDWCLKRVGLNLAYDASWLTKTQGVMLVMSSERAKRELGWSPRHATAHAVLAHFLELASKKTD
ncbi:MAG: NAD-dependent epimerase/dehydratase family protein [Xanthobacteraceae bacterium]